MKKKLFSIILSVLTLFNFSHSFATQSVSILLEEDNDTLMVIYRDESGSDGMIISYGGYKWFKEVYINQTDNEATFIQPARYGVSGKMETWMLPRYEIDDFKFIFKTRGDDQYISFLSPQAINEIDGYITQGKRFSIATLQPEKAWYAGTFKPIKKLDQFLELSNKNTRIFCKILYEDFMLNSFNREISSYNVSQLVENAGYKCNSNFELVNKPKSNKFSSKEEIKPLNETLSPKKNYKNYWWVLVILALGAFYLYTKTLPKPKKTKRLIKNKPTGLKKNLINYWEGKVSYGFSYWICLNVIGTIIALPSYFFLTDKFIESASNLVVLLLAFYALLAIMSQIYLIIGTWRSAEFYKLQKRKLKQSLIWGYLGQITIVLSIISKVSNIFI